MFGLGRGTETVSLQAHFVAYSINPKNFLRQGRSTALFFRFTFRRTLEARLFGKAGLLAKFAFHELCHAGQRSFGGTATTNFFVLIVERDFRVFYNNDIRGTTSVLSEKMLQSSADLTKRWPLRESS